MTAIVLRALRCAWGQLRLPIAAALLLLGCADYREAERPDDWEAPRTIAILGFSFHEDPDAAAAFEDGCVAGLLGAGVKVVERQYIRAIAEEKGMAKGEEINPRYLQSVGRMVGADAGIAGTLSVKRGVKGAVSLRLVSMKTGEILATVRMGARIDKGAKVGEKACLELLRLR